MVQVNPLTREVLIKVVYYGPGLGGKTTSLQAIHNAAPVETRGEMVSLATPVDRTLYFDFLPLRLAPVRDHAVRLQVFTVPGQVYFNATRKLVLTGADGLVFVADSQRQRHDANIESLENLEANLIEQGRRLPDVRHVIQLNKRDLPNILPVEELSRTLNPHGAPSFPTCATRGEGVLDALDALVASLLDDLQSGDALVPGGRSSKPLAMGRADVGLEEQIGRASEQIWRTTVKAALETRESAAAAAAESVAPAVQAVAPSTEAPAPSIAPARVLSWAALFAEDRDEVRALEQDLALGKLTTAIGRADGIAQGLLARAAADAGLAPNPDLLVLALGLDGNRWLAFRRLVRRIRDGGPVAERDALSAFAIVIELRLRLDRVL